MIAIIPARGGSKGLPGKNIKLLHGKPLIAYTIEAAINSKEVSRVIVSTDCSDIQSVALSYGASVPFMRPKHLAEDHSRAIDTYKFTVDKLQRDENISIDEFIVLQPTSPLRISSDIDDAVRIFRDNNADSVISYTVESHPILWHKYLDENHKFIDIFHNQTIGNRQEHRLSYYPNGSVYIFKTKLVESGHYYSKNSFAYIMPRNRSIDIDTVDDFNYAEFVLNNHNVNNE